MGFEASWGRMNLSKFHVQFRDLRRKLPFFAPCVAVSKILFNGTLCNAALSGIHTETTHFEDCQVLREAHIGHGRGALDNDVLVKGPHFAVSHHCKGTK